jgi:putative iron-dependent peroxidase
MPAPQSGILPEGNSHALFVTAVIEGDSSQQEHMLRACSAVPEITDRIAAIDPAAGLVSTVAVGSDAWDRLIGEVRPAQLRPFRARSENGRSAPATAGDLLFHIRSERADLNYLVLREIVDSFSDNISVVEEVVGFRYLDSRDLTGFVDGTENPEGEERAEVALVGKEDPANEDGSYVSVQRYIHRLQEWEQLSVEQQESIIGRTKSDDVELGTDAKPPTAHISRVVIKEDGDELEILRHSMPYGNSQESGLLFIAYAKTPDNFDRMLDRMMHADKEGHYDHLMDYTQAVSGASFFAPSRDFLRKLTAVSRG